MADDKLKIVASVEDQFTGPLSKLQKSLKGVGDETAKQGATWKKDWAGVRDEVGKFQGVLRGFDPIFAAVGVTGFGAAMSITGMVSALRGFSGSTQQLSMLSRETGVAVDKLRAFGALGERFGVSADSMKGSVASFATTMFDLRRRWGEAYSSLQAMNLGKLAEDLVNAPNMDEALKRAVDGIQAIPEPEVRRRVSRMLFGTDDVARIAGSMTGKFSEALAQVQKEVGHLNKETEEAAARFEQSMGRIGAAAERLKLKILGPMLKGTADLIEDAEKHGLRGNEGEQALRNQISPFGGPEATPRDKLEGRRAQVEQQLKLLETGPRGADYQRKHDRMADELKRVADELQKVRENGGASVSPSSFGGSTGGGGSLIQKAAWGGGGLGGGGGGGGGGGSSGGFGSSGGAGAATPSYGNPGGLSGGGNGQGGGSNSGGGSDGGGRDIDTPRGSGRGNPKAARTGEMMRYAMDQLRREGVLESQLRQAAAHLVGQAQMESGLDPNKVHDGGTGYGIYGARDPKGWGAYRGARRSDMVRWLKANGYAPNSAEGQMREMVHQAMSGRYPRTKAILMGRGTGDVDHDTNTITKEFESPAIINRRSGAVRNALRVGPDEAGANAQGGFGKGGPLVDKSGPLTPPPTDPDLLPNGTPRVLKPNSMKDAPGLTADEAARRRDVLKADARRPEVLADPEDERRQIDKPFYSEEDDRRAARDLGISLRDRRRKAEAGAEKPRPKVGDALMDRFYGKGPAGGPAMQMPGAPVTPKGTLHIKFDNAPAGMTHRADTAGLFRDTTVSKGRSQMDMDRA